MPVRDRTPVVRVYRGCWGEDGRIAYVKNGNRISSLGLPYDARIEWGVHSRGTALLARAILIHAGLTVDAAEKHLASVTDRLASMPRHGFAVSEDELESWIPGGAAAHNTARESDP